MSDLVRVQEIYHSIQGESTWAGLPCTFVRLTGCPLRCSYCDSAYAFAGGEKMELGDVVKRVEELGGAKQEVVLPGVGKVSVPLVEVTGGEPLIQPGCIPLLNELSCRGFKVLLETSGAISIKDVPESVHTIMDIKCPSSGESDRLHPENIEILRPSDEVKFVCGTWEDIDFTEAMIRDHGLADRATLLVSWVAPLSPEQQDKSLKPLPEGMKPISRLELVDECLRRNLPVRFQLQMHKFIWPPDMKGV